jgi:hypothetical protein
MHGPWFIIRWGWTAVDIAYLLLFLIGSRRLHGEAKKNSSTIFAVFVFLFVIRELILWFFGVGVAYRLAIMVVGLAAGGGALYLIRALMAQKPDEGTNEAENGEGQIQSLKLN